MRDLRLHIEAGGGPLAAPLAVHTHAPEQLHHDHGLALLSGLAATLTILVVCAFWIGTGWAAGSGAAALAAAACCLFATLDDPAPALKSFLVSVVLAVLAVGIGLFGILPLVHDFEILAFVLAAFFVPRRPADRDARHAGRWARRSASSPRPCSAWRAPTRLISSAMPTAASRPCWASRVPR